MPVKVTSRDRGLAKRIAGFHSGRVQVGVWSQNIHPEAHKPVAELAAQHELGLGVPQRSFLRAWVDTHQPFVALLMRRYWIDVAAGRMTTSQALTAVGIQLQKAVVAFIEQGKVMPPLSPVTIANKGHAIPLIETGTLIDAIESRVQTTARPVKKNALTSRTHTVKS